MFTYFYGCGFSVAISRLMLLSFVAVLPFMGGCGADDNPIVDEHEHEHEEEAPFHADADGFVLEVDGAEIYRQFQGTQTGGLTVGVDEEIKVHVAFLDPSGAEFHPGEEGEDHAHSHDEEVEAFALGLTGYDTAIIDIHLLEEGEEHAGEEEGEHAEDEHEHEEDEHEHEEDEHEHEENAEALHFELVGLKAGKTQIKLQLLHGDHPDFTAALPIPVTVQ